MKVTLQIHGEDGVRHYGSLAAAVDAFEQDCDELSRFGGLFMTAASNGEECNHGAWVAIGHVDAIDYPDRILEVRPRRTPDRWSGRWWIVRTERV